MPGKRITDLQVTKYKELRGKHIQEAAAAKTGISVATARRIESLVSLPSQRPPRHWRTCADPLSEVWEAEVVPMLESAPALMAVMVLEELQRRHPERFDQAVLRTLQRRIRQWRAEHGDEREIFFAQEHPPGRLGLSDFTVADELGVSIAGEMLSHRLCQFAFAHIRINALRHDSRQEPYAVVPHVRICAGAGSNPRPYRDRRSGRERLLFHLGLFNTGGQGAPRLTEFHAGCFIAPSSSATTCARVLGSPVLPTGHGAPRLAEFQAGCFIAEFKSESMSARLRLEACSRW